VFTAVVIVLATGCSHTFCTTRAVAIADFIGCTVGVCNAFRWLFGDARAQIGANFPVSAIAVEHTEPGPLRLALAELGTNLILRAVAIVDTPLAVGTLALTGLAHAILTLLVGATIVAFEAVNTPLALFVAHVFRADLAIVETRAESITSLGPVTKELVVEAQGPSTRVRAIVLAPTGRLAVVVAFVALLTGLDDAVAAGVRERAAATEVVGRFAHSEVESQRVRLCLVAPQISTRSNIQIAVRTQCDAVHSTCVSVGTIGDLMSYPLPFGLVPGYPVRDI